MFGDSGKVVSKSLRRHQVERKKLAVDDLPRLCFWRFGVLDLGPGTSD